MEIKKTKIGVCLDYTIAFLLEEKEDENLITIIRAEDDTQPQQSKPVTRRRRNKEFVQKVYDLVKTYDRVSLFGTEAARLDFLRTIRNGKRKDIEVNSIPLGKGKPEEQRINFINSYFQQ